MIPRLIILTFLAIHSAASPITSPFAHDPGFDIRCVTALAKSTASHSWEYGTTAEALLELYNPEYSVFGAEAFPIPTLNKASTPSLDYAATKLKLYTTGLSGFSTGTGATGDPASLGVSAILLGKTDNSYAKASARTITYLTTKVPRYANKAISQRYDVAELW